MVCVCLWEIADSFFFGRTIFRTSAVHESGPFPICETKMSTNTLGLCNRPLSLEESWLLFGIQALSCCLVGLHQLFRDLHSHRSPSCSVLGPKRQYNRRGQLNTILNNAHRQEGSQAETLSGANGDVLTVRETLCTELNKSYTIALTSIHGTKSQRPFVQVLHAHSYMELQSLLVLQ